MRVKDFQDGTYQVGQVVGVVSARVDGGRTQPPERYTEQSLLEDMTNAHKFAQDPGDRAVLSEISGLGTSRTRAAIIAALIERGLLVKEHARGRTGKNKTVIVSSQMARDIAGQLPSSLTSVATTAKWELGFRLVEQGKATPAQMQTHLDRALAGIVDDARRRADGKAAGTAGAGSSRPARDAGAGVTNSVTRGASLGAQSSLQLKYVAK